MILDSIIAYVYDRNFIYQILATISAYFCIRFVQFLRYRIERQSIFENFGIPGPKPSMFDGHYSVYGVLDRGKRTIYKTEEQMVKKYGKLYGVFIGDEASIIISDLEVAKRIFLEKSKSFTERTRLFLDIPLGNGILFAKNARWKVMRKMLSPFFSKYTMRGSSSTQFIEDSLKLTIEYIDQKLLESKSSSNEAIIDVHDLMKATSLHLISKMAIRLPNVHVKEGEENVKSLDSFLSGADKGVVWMVIICPLFRPVIEFLANHVEHDQTLALIFRGLNKIIDEGLEKYRHGKSEMSEQQQQVIDLMIRLHHEGRLTRAEVLGNAESILYAGYDTTSTTLSYIFWVLAKYPDIQEKVRSDVAAHGLESEYLMKVIKETMRLYPTVISFTTRIATETVQINHWTIPKGAKVVYNAWLVNHDPEIWPDPERFDPERFREGVELHPCAYAPFGFGERKCIGYQLAMLEIKMIVCDILLRYKMTLISPDILEIISYVVTLTKPRDKVMLRFERL